MGKIKRILTGLVIGTTVMTTQNACKPKKDQFTPVVKPCPGEYEAKQNQYRAIHNEVLQLLNKNSEQNIQSISLLDFQDKQMTAYCKLTNENTTTYIARFHLDCDENISEMINALKNKRNVEIDETILDNNCFTEDFAVKYYKSNKFNFDKENYVLLNAFLNNSIPDTIGVTCIPNSLYKFTYIVKNKYTNQISRLDHQVIFGLPNYEDLFEGYDNLYHYFLSEEEKYASKFQHTETMYLSDFATQYDYYLGDFDAFTTEIDNNNYSIADLDTLSNELLIKMFEKQIKNNVGEEVKNITFLAIGDRKPRFIRSSSDPVYGNENNMYELSAYFTYEIDGEKYFGNISNIKLQYTPYHTFTLIDLVDNPNKYSRSIFSSQEIANDYFATELLNYVDLDGFQNLTFSTTSAINYYHDQFSDKDFAQIDCFYLTQDKNSDFLLKKVRFTFDKASEEVVEVYCKSGKTIYEFYLEQAKNNNFAKNPKNLETNQITIINPNNLSKHFINGCVLDHLKSFTGCDNVEILLLDYTNNQPHLQIKQSNLFVVYRYTKDGKTYFSTMTQNFQNPQLQDYADVQNLLSRTDTYVPFEGNPFKLVENGKLTHSQTSISKDSKKYINNMLEYLNNSSIHRHSIPTSSFDNIILQCMSDPQVVQMNFEEDNELYDFLTVNVVLISRDKGTGQYSYCKYSPCFLFEEQEFENYKKAVQGATLMDFFFHKLEDSKTSDDMYDFGIFRYNLSNYTNVFSKEVLKEKQNNQTLNNSAIYSQNSTVYEQSQKKKDQETNFEEEKD